MKLMIYYVGDPLVWNILQLLKHGIVSCILPQISSLIQFDCTTIRQCNLPKLVYIYLFLVIKCMLHFYVLYIRWSGVVNFCQVQVTRNYSFFIHFFDYKSWMKCMYYFVDLFCNYESEPTCLLLSLYLLVYKLRHFAVE